MKKFLKLACLAGATLLGALSGTAHAGLNVPRYQVNQRGDFVLVAQAMGTECHPEAMVPAPLVGSIGACGINLFDTGIDIYWRSDSPQVGQCTGNLTITAPMARTSAALVLPANAAVTKAFLYWSARIDVPTPQKPEKWDAQVTFDRQGGFSTVVTAIDHQEFFHANPLADDQYYYQSVADVTALIQTHGVGTYRLSDMDASTLLDDNNNVSYGAWWMVVLYTVPGDPLRNIAVYDDYNFVGDFNNMSVLANLSGFSVPNAGINGKVGIIAYDGDDLTQDDAVKFNGNLISNAANGANNFFNGTRSFLGVPVSNPGDLPRLTGGPNSMSGLDADVIDVTPYLAAGATTAQVNFLTVVSDGYFVAGMVSSITTFSPDFATTTKTAVDVNGGSLLPGDVVEFTILATNTGTDASTNTTFVDPIPVGMTYLPGSIQITSGANVGVKTDGVGDDQAEYAGGAKTVTVRLGAGASAALGGSIAANGSTTVKFKVTIDPNVSGTLLNQGNVSATGTTAAALAFWPTDGNGAANGAPPTSVLVDACEQDAQCPAATPHCLTAPNPNVCAECLQNSDCSNLKPNCDLATNTCKCTPTGPEICGNNIDENCDGVVCECTVDGNCGGPKSGKVCTPGNQCVDGCRGMNGNGCPPNFICTSPDATVGMCFGCLTDAQCGDATSGKVCEPVSHMCVNGCRGAGGNGCAATKVCTSSDAMIGACVECLSDPDCGGPMSGKVCGGAGNTCIEGCRGKDGNGCMAGSLCTSADAAIGECVACLVDADCGGTSSGKVCDTAANTCKDGCRGSNGNGCLAGATCTSNDMSIGQCVQCVTDAECGAADSGKVCDPSTNKCKSGCRGSGGNGCPAGVACTSTDATIGACGGCVSDADCGAIDSGKVCDSLTQKCGAGCRGSGGNQCPSGVACSSSDNTIGACGCTKDADCGATNSGRVCDAATALCGDGCRGLDGNGCASGQTCSSTNGAIGTCAGGDDLAGQGRGILCSTHPGDDGGTGAPWMFGGALGMLLALRRRQRTHS